MSYSFSKEQQEAKLTARAEPAAKAAIGKWFKVRTDSKTIVQGKIVECRLVEITHRYTPAGTRVSECRFESVLDNGLGKSRVFTRDLPR
jgi:hypothetical protein